MIYLILASLPITVPYGFYAIWKWIESMMFFITRISNAIDRRMP